MNPLTETQELARRFNENQAVWARFEQKRSLRKFCRARRPWPEELQDDLDWTAAEREVRQIRCIGILLP